MKRKSSRKQSRRKREEIGRCPTPRAHKRLQDVHQLWHQVEQNYFSPDKFRVSLNSAIQTLRTVTFVLQKNKRLIPDFDNWYNSWQDRMREDRVMRWLIDARNEIVKQGDLETLSTVRMHIVSGWAKPHEKDYIVSPDLTIQEMLDHIKSENIPDEIRKIGSIIIQRRWVAEDLPEWELLDAIAYGFGFLSRLIDDAHAQKGVPIPEVVMFHESDGTTSPPVGTEHLGGKYPCMAQSPFERSTVVNLASGEIVSITYDSEFHKQLPPIQDASERYGFDPNAIADEIKEAKRKGFLSILYYYMKQAKLFLPIDGALVQTVLLGSDKAPPVIDYSLPSDKSELLLFWQKVISDIRRTGADSLIMVSEVWIHSKQVEGEVNAKPRISESGEGIEVLGANAQGEEYTLLTPFHRDGENIIFEETQEVFEINSPQIRSLREVWREMKISGSL